MLTPTMKAQLASRMRKWRVDHGLTLEEVADVVGLSVAMVSRVERGERQLDPMTRIRFARRLGVRVADLFEPTPFEGHQQEPA